MSFFSPRFVVMLQLACLAGLAQAEDGRALIEESLRRHAPPAHVYEEHAFVITDRQGQFAVRTVRYYGRHDKDGSRQLRIIETPAESKGTMLYARRGEKDGQLHGARPSAQVFGTLFSVADLEGEQSRDFRYELEDVRDLDRVAHHVVKAVPADESVARITGHGSRLIYLRKDNLFISRIDHLDREGHLARRQTFRDPQPDAAGAWHAGMILMEDLLDGRRSLLKVDRRVHSSDYVPAALFAGLPGEPQ